MVVELIPLGIVIWLQRFGPRFFVLRFRVVEAG